MMKVTQNQSFSTSKINQTPYPFLQFPSGLCLVILCVMWQAQLSTQVAWQSSEGTRTCLVKPQSWSPRGQASSVTVTGESCPLRLHLGHRDTAWSSTCPDLMKLWSWGTSWWVRSQARRMGMRQRSLTLSAFSDWWGVLCSPSQSGLLCASTWWVQGPEQSCWGLLVGANYWEISGAEVCQ